MVTTLLSPSGGTHHRHDGEPYEKKIRMDQVPSINSGAALVLGRIGQEGEVRDTPILAPTLRCFFPMAPSIHWATNVLAVTACPGRESAGLCAGLQRRRASIRTGESTWCQSRSQLTDRTAESCSPRRQHHLVAPGQIGDSGLGDSRDLSASGHGADVRMSGRRRCQDWEKKRTPAGLATVF